MRVKLSIDITQSHAEINAANPSISLNKSNRFLKLQYHALIED